MILSQSLSMETVSIGGGKENVCVASKTAALVPVFTIKLFTGKKPFIKVPAQQAPTWRREHLVAPHIHSEAIDIKLKNADELLT